MIFSILLRYVSKALDVVDDQVFRMINVNQDIIKLRSTLILIEGILNENEEANNAYIENWRNDLVDIGYEARDVLDDISLTPVNLSTFLPSNRALELLCEYANDIKRVTERFESKIYEIEKYKIIRDAVGEGSKNVPGRPQTGSFVNRQKTLLVGREDVKNKIMEILDSNDSRVHVVRIWGMGGIGKTTLAQFIYNDERVKEKYLSNNRCWLSIGEKKFNAEKIIKDIIGESCTTLGGVDCIQKKLVEKFTGNRFLIVLDDMWHVDGHEWDLLFNPLTAVEKGGVIIITTRIRIEYGIDEIITFTLNPLCSQDCRQIFSSYAFVEDSTTDKMSIGHDNVEKFKGLPLAAKVAGESPKKFPDDVMSTLRWSYNRLQPHLKKCFTYCALFPKDHVFDEKVLVEMWMAHDLIQNVRGAYQYFKELVNASLLQCADGKYMMHDMIHDLALFVSNEEFVTANTLLSTDKLEKARHITIIHDDDSKILKNLRLCNSKRLYTLYTIKKGRSSTCSNDDIVQTVLELLERMRVLVLVSSTITHIPGCISNLKHLRYLDVSETLISSLPDSLCHLHNLQTLVAPLGTNPPEMPRLRSFRVLDKHVEA